MPLYRWCFDRTGIGEFDAVRSALDVGWSAAGPDRAPADKVERYRVEIEALVPSEDDDQFSPGAAVAQNAIACVAYVLRTWETEDPQDAVWAARQLYEAADFIVQQGAAAQTYIEDIEGEAPVQLVLRGIDSALNDLNSSDMARLSLDPPTGPPSGVGTGR
jgi:hypothetical protein